MEPIRLTPGFEMPLSCGKLPPLQRFGTILWHTDAPGIYHTKIVLGFDMPLVGNMVPQPDRDRKVTTLGCSDTSRIKPIYRVFVQDVSTLKNLQVSDSRSPINTPADPAQRIYTWGPR